MNPTREQFAGLYRLESAPIEPVNGDPAWFPYGPDALGYLLYRSDGFMSLHLMAARRPAFPNFDLLGGTPEENHAAFRSFVSFCGRYQLEKDEVWYDIEIASIPNFVGPRAHHSQVEIQGDILFLCSRPFVVSGKLARTRFRWRRIATA